MCGQTIAIGKAIPGFIAWLEEQQTTTPNPAARNVERDARTPRTRNLAPSPYKEYIKPSELKEEKRPNANDAQHPEHIKISSQASATGNSTIDEHLVEFVTHTIQESGFKGSIRTQNLEAFDLRTLELGMTMREIMDFVDFKVWELSELRGETYTATTVVNILTADLIHHKAVISNLEYLKRCEIQRMYREHAEAGSTSEPASLDEVETVDERVEPLPLQAWQVKLKDIVTDSVWQNFLSELQCASGTDTSTLVITRDEFTAQWTADQYGTLLADVLGTSVLRFESNGVAGIECQLTPSPVPSPQTESIGIASDTVLMKTEPALAHWQQKLKAAVPGAAWRMFLGQLEEVFSANTDEFRLLMPNDEFVARYIRDKYGKVIANTLGNCVLECGQTRKIWALVDEK